jgi:hypothetical protein
LPKYWLRRPLQIPIHSHRIGSLLYRRLSIERMTEDGGRG